MQEKSVESAARELLYEARSSGDLLMKLKNGVGDFVKAKRAYVENDDLRDLYLAGLKHLVDIGHVKQTLGTRDMTVFRVTQEGLNSRHDVDSARSHLLKALNDDGFIAKVHSADGEYLHCDGQAFSDIDEERIIYLEAFGHLLQHGYIQPSSESKEMTMYSLVDKPALRRAM